MHHLIFILIYASTVRGSKMGINVHFIEQNDETDTLGISCSSL